MLWMGGRELAVELVTGDVGSGKTTYAVQRILRYDPIRWNREVRYVVPTVEMARQVENCIMDQAGISGILGNVVTTFYNLTREFISRAGFASQLISDIQKSVMLQNLVEQANLDYFKRASEFPGFVDALGEIIGELKISLVKPDELDEAIKRASRELTPASSRKLQELSRLYWQYQKEILEANALHDREGLMWRALEVLENENYLSELKCIVFDGFNDLQPVQREFLQKASKDVSEILVTLTYSEGRPEVFKPVEDTRKFVLELNETSETVLKQQEQPQTAIEHLRSNIFSREPARISSDASVTIIEGGTPGIEIELIGDEIRRLTRDQRLKYGDIAIVARQIETYRARIEREFIYSGIPVEPGRQNLAETAYAKLLVTCIDLITGGWRRADVFRILKSELMDSDLAAACKMEVDAKQAGILQGRDNWFKQWEESDTMLALRKKVLGPVAEFEKELQKAKGVEECINAVKKLTAVFRQKSDDESQAQFSSAARAVEGILQDLLQTERLLRRKLNPTQFLGLLKSSISRDTYRLRGKTQDAVKMLSVTGLGGQKFRAVFVVGMLEKVFPRQIQEESFLRDRERRVLNRYLLHPLRERLPQQGTERHLFFSAAAAAREKLYLTYPAADETATDSLPSFYLDEVRKLFNGNVVTIGRDVTDMIPPVEKVETIARLERSVVYRLSHIPCEQADTALAAYNSLLEFQPSKFNPVFQNCWDKEAVITCRKILNHLANDNRAYQCTELESYAACPFMHFCQRILGLEAIRDKVGALDIGGILHKVLYRLLTELQAKHGNDFNLRILDRVQTINSAFEILQEEIEKNSKLLHLPAHELELQRHTLRMYLKRYLTGEIEHGPEQLIPAYFELEFGSPPMPDRNRDPHSTDKPLEITNENGCKVKIRGKIDRVDVCSDGGLVIDYKFKKSNKITDFEKGLTLQAMVYALALEQLFDINALGAEYRLLSKWEPDGYYVDASGIKKKNRTMSEQDFDAMLKQCKQFIISIAEDIRAGKIPVAPKDCKDYCSFKCVCRTDDYSQILQKAALVKDDAEEDANEHA